MATFKATQVGPWFRIYINNLIHIQLRKDDILGFQSWIDTETGFFMIEFYTPTQDIPCEYVDLRIWKGMLKLLEKELIQK